jgi:glutamate formiminotransferase
VQIAHAAGREMFKRFGVPIYFYEAAALRPECRALEDIRRGQYEQLRELVKSDLLRRPDIGGAQLHSTAGATVVGARKFLVAFNVNLDSADVAIAKAIARKIRASGGGLPALKAIGVLLQDEASHPRAQVAINLTDIEETNLPAAFQAVAEQASKLGVSLAGSELVGLAPQAAFAGVPPRQVGLPESAADQFLEQRLARLLPATYS